MKQVVIIDDDPFHVSVIEQRIQKGWPDSQWEFQAVGNEKEFMQRFDSLAEGHMDLVIIDQMIPYTSEEDNSDNSSALQLSAFRGGTRCWERLRNDARTRMVPIVFYTILDREAVPSDAVYVKKTGDVHLTELLEKVGTALRLQTPAQQ